MGIGLLELGIDLNTSFCDILDDLKNAITSSKYDLLTEAHQEVFPDNWFNEDEGWFSPTGVAEINERMSNEQMLQKLWFRAQKQRQSSAAQ